MNIYTVHYRPSGANRLETVEVRGKDKWDADKFFRAQYPDARIYAILFSRTNQPLIPIKFNYVITYQGTDGKIKGAFITAKDKATVFYMYERYYASKILSIQCQGEYVVTV